MKRITTLVLTFSFGLSPGVFAQGVLRPVDFSKVKIDDGFWSPRLQSNLTGTIPANIYNLEIATEHIRHYELAAAGQGKFVGHVYDDSDVYKAIEGIAYALQNNPDASLEAKCDEWINKIAAAQWEDGYLNTFFSLRKDQTRWSSIMQHEMYCAGHMIEGAIAYYKATGKRKLLDVAIRFADYLTDTFGPYKRFWIAGHEEIELAMVKLFELTGKRKYLNWADWQISVRGTGNVDRSIMRGKTVNIQDAVPVGRLRKADGHAVRAMYLFSGMADVARYLKDPEYLEALDSLWHSVVERNMYITGGIGSMGKGESFGKDYELPNKTAYCETCAAVGMVFWNFRMNRLYADAKYIDILEKCLYNGVLSGVNLDGDRFFYVNPLETDGGHRRVKWFGTPCCPSNLCRLIPSVGGYIYGESDKAAYVNLFIGSEVSLSDGATLRMKTNYPWSGEVEIAPEHFGKALYVRVPGWCEKWQAEINGKAVKAKTDKGYAIFKCKWADGDILKLHFDMPVRLVAADPRVLDDAGRRAVTRGPLVYCAEEEDNPDMPGIAISESGVFNASFEPELLGGIEKIVSSEGVSFVPYCLWDNRSHGAMKVWIDLTGEAAAEARERAQTIIEDTRGKEITFSLKVQFPIDAATGRETGNGTFRKVDRIRVYKAPGGNNCIGYTNFDTGRGQFRGTFIESPVYYIGLSSAARRFEGEYNDINICNVNPPASTSDGVQYEIGFANYVCPIQIAVKDGYDLNSCPMVGKAGKDKKIKFVQYASGVSFEIGEALAGEGISKVVLASVNGCATLGGSYVLNCLDSDGDNLFDRFHECAPSAKTKYSDSISLSKPAGAEVFPAGRFIIMTLPSTLNATGTLKQNVNTEGLRIDFYKGDAIVKSALVPGPLELKRGEITGIGSF